LERQKVSQAPGIGRRTVVESKIPGLTKVVVPAYCFAAELLPSQNEKRGIQWSDSKRAWERIKSENQRGSKKS
jgi:hypothetical protein